ncbi:polar growth protein [Yamadazyma tenuis]|uniref:PH-domain-containing protein n=1 Tax=Candida tenuis (strain ATCC 10573 / BCRC 21748 / CBS 615 / JCM 9827 / NBRC 10315 / NRRL Y-1498 / VKM Y-70) TaxID=590646 RepID=G3BF28_CANTC|nr:uncharacterized protein CANTEDRAFT_137094 [Yamadazyma tenuis ATCC 10573]EGV60616.1 hypothetical protein CANTEDRAFT_137094 [Yamadazyma tenuis ATCC 10573]WEJ94136.1 polar growth protein [Yamadazyma tenuis]
MKESDIDGSSRGGATASVYLCIKQFNSRLGDELNLKVGDKIQVLSDDSEYNDGWYMGKNLSTGKVGLYPKSFTQVLVEDTPDDYNLLRSRSRSRSKRLSSPTTPISAKPDSPVSKLKSNFESLSIKRPANGNYKTPGTTATATTHAKSSSSLFNPKTSKIFDEAHDLNDNNDTFNTTNGHSHLDDIDDEDNIDAEDREFGVNKTMNDIDKALEELQSDSYIHSTNTGHKRAPSNMSLTEDLNPKDAMSWTPKQVTSYFALGLGFDTSVAGKFARHKITGAILFELDLAHLKELDIDSFGTRFEIYKEIENLKKIVDGHKELDTDKNKTSEPQLLDSAKITRGPSEYGHQRKKSQSYEELRDTNKIVSPKMDKAYKFGEATNKEMYGSNNNVSTSVLNPPTESAGIKNRLSRPASSIYEQSVHSRNHSRNISGTSDYYGNHRRNSSVILSNNNHKRNSSMFSFMSKDKDEVDNKKYKEVKEKVSEKQGRKQEKLISPAKIKKERLPEVSTPTHDIHNNSEEIDIDSTQFSPRKSKSINHKYDEPRKLDFKDEKRSVSDSTATLNSSASSTPGTSTISRFKTLRTASTTNFKNLTSSKKSKTSAFQEGIRSITPDEAIKSANYSGFMAKRTGNNLSWRSRYFTLHGTRLSYFTSLKDKKEKGLIDITAHKVIPIDTDGEDKYIALYAASTGFGRYCFKLIPPAPGFKKGLTFTQPKTHFFAVETQDEMRGWIKALMTATIDIDDSVPVVSSCSTPTVSLAKAQELLARAREETKLKDEERAMQGNNGFLGDLNDFGDDEFSESQLTSFIGNYTLDPNTSGENSPLVESLEEGSESTSSPSEHPNLSIDTSGKPSVKGPTTPQLSNPTGFASPYLLASGLLSPKSNNGNVNFSPTMNHEDASSTSNSFSNTYNNSKASNTTTPIDQKREYFTDLDSNGSTPKSPASNGRVKSAISQSSGHKKKRHSEKLLAYSNDGSGNHTFVIKQKR